VVASVIMRRWITLCGVAPCTGMSGSGFGLSSRLRIVLFFVRDMLLLALRQ
jgi:hypothetical protein